MPLSYASKRPKSALSRLTLIAGPTSIVQKHVTEIGDARRIALARHAGGVFLGEEREIIARRIVCADEGRGTGWLGLTQRHNITFNAIQLVESAYVRLRLANNTV